MKALIFLTALLGSLTLFASFDVTTHVPQDTVLIGKVDLDRVRDSRLALQMMEQEATRYTAFTTFFIDIIGLDPESMHTAWLLSPAKDTGVVILQGAIDINQLHFRFGQLPNVRQVARADTLFAAEFNDENKPEPRLMAVLDNQTVIIGDLTSADAFLDARALPHLLFPADQAEVQQVATSTKPLYLTMIGGPQRWNDFDRQFAPLVKHIHLTASIDQDIDLVLSLTTYTPEQAEALASLAEGLIKLKALDDASAGQPANPLVRATLKSGVVTRQDRDLTMTFAVPGPQVLKRVAQHP